VGEIGLEPTNRGQQNSGLGSHCLSASCETLSFRRGGSFRLQSLLLPCRFPASSGVPQCSYGFYPAEDIH
jgi:hypothetical protein